MDWTSSTITTALEEYINNGLDNNNHSGILCHAIHLYFYETLDWKIVDAKNTD